MNDATARYPTHSAMISLCIGSFQSMLGYGFINFHVTLFVLLAHKMTCPYLVQAKELLLTNNCPQHLKMGMYTHIIFISLSVWLLWTWHTCCAHILLDGYEYKMIFNKCIQITKENCIHFISQSHDVFPERRNICIHILSVHRYLRANMGWYLVLLYYQSYNNTNVINPQCLIPRLYLYVLMLFALLCSFCFC